MLLKKFQAMQTEQKPVIIGKTVLEELRALNGKNILAIDKALDGKLVDIRRVVSSFNDGTEDREIISIGLEYKDRIVVVPTSRNFDHEVFEGNKWFKSILYVRPTKLATDAEGEYTGPETVVFGMPGELNIISNTSLVEAVEVEK